MRKIVHISSADENTFVVTGERDYGFLKELMERKQNQKNYASWIVAATDTNVDIIACKADEIHFDDEFAQTLYNSIALRTRMSEKLREQTAMYKESKIVPPGADKLRWHPDSSPYQRVAAYNAHLSEGYNLFMEQGTGKTLTAIERMSNLPEGSRCIVITPNNVRLNWVKELEKFCMVPFKVNVMRGGQLNRVDALVETFKRTGEHLSVAILGYDSIAGSWDALQIAKWELAILDESHYIRNPSTKRWRYVERIRDTAKKRMCLTGTPFANSINDFYCQFEFCGKGFSGFTNFKAFKKFFGIYDKAEDNSYETFLGLQNVPILKDRLSRYSFIITKKEALPDLPDKVYDIEEVEMSEAQEAAYNKLAEELSFEIETELANAENNQALVVNNVMTMLLKLNQITSGFLNVPAEIGPDGVEIHPKRTVQFMPNPKLERLMEILDAKGADEKTLVWCSHVYDIKAIEAACQRNAIKAVSFYGGTSEDARAEAERAFNEDALCKVFIGNPAAGGTGLNLLGYPPGNPDAATSNADHVIYYSQDWSSLKRSQSEDRNHRRGTRVQVRITDLCVPNTIDVQIRERVVEKRTQALEITDLRALLREVLNRE